MIIGSKLIHSLNDLKIYDKIMIKHLKEKKIKLLQLGNIMLKKD